MSIAQRSLPRSPLQLLLMDSPCEVEDRDVGVVYPLVSLRLGGLPTDRLVIGDPFSERLSAVVPPAGVRLPAYAQARSLVRALESTDPVTAALGLVFQADVAVARWQRATEQVETDCGLGGFASGAHVDALSSEPESLDELVGEVDESEFWLGTLVARPDGHLVVSATGAGEGAYAVWWGLDAQGQAVCLVVDFDVLSEHVYLEERAPLPLRRGVSRLPTLPDVRLHAGWLSSRRPTVKGQDLAVGDFVYTRVEAPDGTLTMPRVSYSGPGGGVMRLDLRRHRDAVALRVRRVCGRRAMAVTEPPPPPRVPTVGGAALRALVAANDADGLDDRAGSHSLPCAFLMDPHDDPEAVVGYVAGALGLTDLVAEWRSEALWVSWGASDVRPPLRQAPSDGPLLLCVLNALFRGVFSLRCATLSAGGDRALVCALSVEEWAALEDDAPERVVEWFTAPEVFFAAEWGQ